MFCGGFFLEGDDCNLISISNAMAVRNGDINEFNPFAFHYNKFE